MANGETIVRSATPGPTLFADFRITGPDGTPLPDVEVHIWHSSPIGFYENQDPDQAAMNLRGIFRTDADGRFSFRSVRPGGYPIPTDGPVGDLLRAQRRHPYRPAHLHILAHAPGYKTLITQLFVDDDEHLDTGRGLRRHLLPDRRLPAPRRTVPRPGRAAALVLDRLHLRHGAR